MNLTKSYEYFNPVTVEEKIHIIGCGSVGSALAALLARLGLKNFVLYDFDTVEAHNIANQMFVDGDIGQLKVDATKRIICDINPEAEKCIKTYPKGYVGQPLNGYVFLAVDNIDLRREICKENRLNQSIKVMFDFRTRLEDAQHYAAEWGNLRAVDNFIKTMEFSHEEAHEATPKTACGTVLGVAPTVWTVCCLGVCNFINYVRKGKLRPITVVNPFEFEVY